MLSTRLHILWYLLMFFNLYLVFFMVIVCPSLSRILSEVCKAGRHWCFPWRRIQWWRAEWKWVWFKRRTNAGKTWPLMGFCFVYIFVWTTERQKKKFQLFMSCATVNKHTKIKLCVLCELTQCSQVIWHSVVDRRLVSTKGGPAKHWIQQHKYASVIDVALLIGQQAMTNLLTHEITSLVSH